MSVRRGYAEAWLKEHLDLRAEANEAEHEAGSAAASRAPSICAIGLGTSYRKSNRPAFEHAFMPHMLTGDGGRLVDRALGACSSAETAGNV